MRMRHIILLFGILIFNTIGYSKNKTWQCIDEAGNVKFTIEAMYVSDFSNGLAVVYKNTLVNNQWITGRGYINQLGQVVIPCDLDKAMDFKADVTWIKRKGEDFYRLIDKNGTEIPTKNYKKVKNFAPERQKIAAVYEDGKMGFVNQQGEEVISCKYIGGSLFSDGLTSVCSASATQEAYGFINEVGEEVIPLTFKQAGQSSFYNGLARASIGGKTVLIDTQGKPVFKTVNGNIQGQNFGLVLVITKPNRKGWGWVNFEDQFVIDPIYDHATSFNEDGYAIVEKDGLKGLIDVKGNVVLPLKYETVYADISKDGFILGVYPSPNGTSLANAKKDYFNADLELLNLTNVKYLTGAIENLIMFSDMDNNKGYMNRNFQVVIPAKYQKSKPFSEGLAWVRE